MFSIKLKEMYQSLTYSEMKVADYLNENKEKAVTLNGEEIAKLTNTSKSTISRLSQKLGYSSLKSLLDDLKNDNENESDNLVIKSNDSCVKSCEKLQFAYENALDLSVKSLNYEEIEKCADLLEKAEKIVCFGTHISLVIARYLAMKLQEIGCNVICDEDIYYLTSIICQMTSKDVVVLVSHSGTSYLTRRIAEIAKENGVALIAIVGMDGGPVRKLADIAITSHIYGTNRTLAYAATKCSQLYLMDVLYLNLYKRHEEQYDNSAEKMFKELAPEIGRDDYTKY